MGKKNRPTGLPQHYEETTYDNRIKRNYRRTSHTLWMKWLYYYGGASDVVSLKEFRDTYDSDQYGDIDTYSDEVCPCAMCLEGYIRFE